MIDESTIFGVVGVMVTITVFELQQKEKTVKRLEGSLATFSPAESSQVEFGGVGQIYSHFNPAVKKMVEESNCNTRIDVLGLTLFSAWPVALAPHIENGDIRNCTINAYILAPEFLTKNKDLFKEDWLNHASGKPKEIQEFCTENDSLLKQRNVRVNVKPYAFFPGVHGFRTSNGYLMISFIHWSRQQKTVDNPNQFYEIFPPQDTSARAKAYRDLFDNWINRADRG